jgi:hypothetical protein
VTTELATNSPTEMVTVQRLDQYTYRSGTVAQKVSHVLMLCFVFGTLSFSLRCPWERSPSPTTTTATTPAFTFPCVMMSALLPLL